MLDIFSPSDRKRIGDVVSAALGSGQTFDVPDGLACPMRCGMSYPMRKGEPAPVARVYYVEGEPVRDILERIGMV